MTCGSTTMLLRALFSPPADGDPHADVEHDEGNEGKKEEEEKGTLKDFALQLTTNTSTSNKKSGESKRAQCADCSAMLPWNGSLKWISNYHLLHCFSY